jgi:signal transduction histidine kinase
MIGGFWQIRKGLSTVEQLRTRLSSVHRGETQRVDGTYPNEIQPLVDDLNALLEDRERSVQRAIAKAGGSRARPEDAACRALAGGRTRRPLRDMRTSRNRSGHQVESHAQAHRLPPRRMREPAASGAKPGTHSSVRPSVDALVRTLMQLHTERGLTIDVHVGPEHAVRCQREDLEEMLGNLLDNACKWARGSRRPRLVAERVGL